MTTDQPGSVDFDLLADYAGGALDGTPDQARVAALVETDPAWAGALDELRTADALVRSDLAALGPVEPIPAEVAQQLQEALRSERATAPAPVTSLVQRRWRRARMIATGAIAAGLIAIAGMAGSSLLGVGTDGSSDSGITSGDARDREASGAEKAAPGAAENSDQLRGYPVPVAASGNDYTKENLSGVRRERNAAAADAPIQPPAGLGPLAAPGALAECLSAVDAVYPGTVTMADYARFEGAPAVIIAITTYRGETQVVVVGAECGRNGMDEKYHTSV
ncbi:MAG: hypothetical protein ACRDTM_07045 [Micromonosporaceae bacterium]